MVKSKQGDAKDTKKSAVGMKSGAGKKPALTAIEGGKAEKKPTVTIALLRDGKTPANPEAMRKALNIYGIAHAPDAPPDVLLALLRKHLAKTLKNIDENSKIKCTAVCTEIATDETEFCPFCGDEGADEEEPVGAEDSSEVVTTPTVVVEEKEDPALESNEEIEAVLNDGGDEVDAGEPVDAVESAVAKLDERVGRINSYRRNLASCSYDMGIELAEIQKAELWKARGHGSFKEFCEKELEIGRGMAYKLIGITTEFDRKTFEVVGSKKLALIAGIQDSEARDAAIEAAKKGATTKEVERHANEAKGKPTAPPKEKSSASAPVKRMGNEITLLTKVGTKAQFVGFRSATSNRPIQAYKDDAYAELKIAESILLRTAPKFDKDKNLIGITVAFVREGA